MSLAEFQRKWQQDYPGEAHALVSLRENLAYAERRRDRTRNVFEDLEADHESTCLPMNHWDLFTRRHYTFFEKLYLRAQCEFTKALKLLHDLSQSLTTRTVAKAKLEPPAPPPVVEPVKRAVWYQMATIQVIDGKVVTTVDYNAHYWLTAQTLDIARGYRRQYCFPDGVVPEPYAYLLEHNGITRGHSVCFYITYSPSEFMRLCQLEVDTNSEYLVDGDRLRYERY